jgi:hypothetical protein
MSEKTIERKHHVVHLMSFLTVSAEAPFIPSSWFMAELAASAAPAAFGATSGPLDWLAATTNHTLRFENFNLLRYGLDIQILLNRSWLLTPSSILFTNPNDGKRDMTVLE